MPRHARVLFLYPDSCHMDSVVFELLQLYTLSYPLVPSTPSVQVIFIHLFLFIFSFHRVGILLSSTRAVLSDSCHVTYPHDRACTPSPASDISPLNQCAHRRPTSGSRTDWASSIE